MSYFIILSPTGQRIKRVTKSSRLRLKKLVTFCSNLSTMLVSGKIVKVFYAWPTWCTAHNFGLPPAGKCWQNPFPWNCTFCASNPKVLEKNNALEKKLMSKRAIDKSLKAHGQIAPQSEARIETKTPMNKPVTFVPALSNFKAVGR